MQYSFYETRKNVWSLVKTKLFHNPARLIRYPVFLRNKKNIHFSVGFTCGYNCRLECIYTELNKGHIQFGENVRIGDYVHIAAAKSITIGDNVLMASHILITDLDHGSYNENTEEAPDTIPAQRKLYSQEVVIGNNVWLGENVTILKGVTIGDGSIIGANAMVLSDIPEYCVAVGSPAKIIKRYDFNTKKWRYNDDKI